MSEVYCKSTIPIEGIEIARIFSEYEKANSVDLSEPVYSYGVDPEEFTVWHYWTASAL